MKSGGHRRATILADALEAVVGAIYLDQGIEVARRVAERLFEAAIDALPSASELKDPKTRLQEWLQGRGHPLPDYTVLEVSGEPHDQRFQRPLRRRRLSRSRPSPTAAAGGARNRRRRSASCRIRR